MKHPNYQCPLCQLALTANPQGFNCANNHQFDGAKEGYVNLLPVQKKGSKVPGDSKAMVMARRDFLATDAYGFLRQAVVDTLKDHLEATATIIDAGCGEGYYTNAFGEAFVDYQVYGVDIAKAAIRYAAKRSQQVHFAVASNIDLPFADNVADLVCKIFAPIAHKEIIRVLKPQGLLLSVVPGPRHLFELKQKIYEFPKEHLDEACPEGFERAGTQSFSTTQTLTEPDQIANLAQMTPFAWKIGKSEKQQLVEGGDFEVTFDFALNLYKAKA